MRTLDRIRFELNADDAYAEFVWFAREYPRVYRYHIDHAKFRLAEIYAKYQRAHRYFGSELSKVSYNSFGMAMGNIDTLQVYWDFESFLNAVSSSLDILARIIGTAYIELTPPSFNKLCKKSHLSGCVDILRAAQTRWVSRMKDYRDCFVHYTSVDTLWAFGCNLYSDGFEVRCKLPTNPNIRDILGFRFSRRVEVLKYAIHIYRQFSALDRRSAKQISSDYKIGEFPKRKDNLFFIGTRRR